MSLHIDLFTENERANPSGKILQTTLITVAVVILLGLACYVFQTFFMLQASQASLARAQRRNDEMKQNHKVALALIADIAEARACLDEMTAFSNVQSRVAAQLYAMAVSVPPEIQLTQLKVGNALVAGGDGKNLPARQYTASITGRTDAQDVNARIRGFILELRESGLFGTVTPGGVSVDPSKSTDRIFEVNFALEPRSYQLASERKAK